MIYIYSIGLFKFFLSGNMNINIESELIKNLYSDLWLLVDLVRVIVENY